jgi:hypothetical protein
MVKKSGLVEKKFIKSCINAVMLNDQQYYHVLLEHPNKKKEYIKVKIGESMEFKYDDGTWIKCICVISPELINILYRKSGGGTDEVTQAWIKRAIKDIIKYGEKIAGLVYSY